LTDLAFYEEYLGPYPFRADKYGVAETPHLGMEHQTIIAYGNDFTLNEHGFDWLHHHELGHEWWGNLVTALDWRDFWLHEGFCSYMQALYAGDLSGPDAYHAAMAPSRPRIRNVKPLAPRESKTEGEMYLLPPDYVESDGDIYNKGKWVLHTLRYLIGDEAFLRSLRRMAYPSPEMEALTDGRQTRFATTDDFRLIAEEESGRDLDWFFEVYARQPVLPKLIVDRVGNELTIRWDTPNELPFPMPVDVEVDGTTTRIEMTSGRANLSLSEVSAAPSIDPLNWILKEEG
jgi:aminopeptidase N